MNTVAILGFGVVGSGTAEVLEKNRADIAARGGVEAELKYILDVRDFPDSPYGKKHVKEFSVIENDPDVAVVAETIGGVGVAYEFTKRALKKGKHVVTSNKELVATHGYELLRLAAENGVNYLFEASVGGGIPVLRPLRLCLTGNRIDEICGILNGTTNYIFTRMIRGGLTLEAALKEAQELGYAEQNPTADVDGHDACRKICILSSLAWGRHVYPDSVPTEGIRGVTLADVTFAKRAGYVIKLLGRAVRTDDGKTAAYVAPHLVPTDNLLSGVDDVFNGVAIRGNAVGDTLFYGRGAGKLPTASAVVGDIIDALRLGGAPKYPAWDDGDPKTVSDPRLLKSVYFVRFSGSFEEAKRAFGDIVPIQSEGPDDGETAFFTPELTGEALDARASSIPGGILSKIRVLS
ncbi:homoserine dehydrogenase [Oscillospiraceae bacterium OttesenSCG-928-G22]|nr:homoserine dehydrogenase [Oscillospiraceae bacterium OttesenSCG-928-G22]